MLDTRVRILDIDGSVPRQDSFLAAVADAEIVDLRDLEGHLRFMSLSRWRRRLAEKLDAGARGRLTFLGSGDFHHVSATLVAQWSTPISVVVFDGHPDWDLRPPWPCCGSWINEVLAMPHVARVMVIGLGATDLRGWRPMGGNIAPLLAGKLELYPVSWRTSRTRKTMSAVLANGTRIETGGATSRIHWPTIRPRRLGDLMGRIVESLPTPQVYLSIDKDCLPRTDAITNWEVGELSLDELLGAVGTLAAGREIVGADVTGEYSTGSIRNRLFAAIARADHPAVTAPPTTDSMNAATNIAILDTLLPTARNH